MGITIEQNGEVIAHHTTESGLSHYGQPVWVVENDDPQPGPAVWRGGEMEINMDILEIRGGWLVCRQPDGLLCGVIWSDGAYYSDVLVDESGDPVRELKPGVSVRNTIQFDSTDAADLGSIL